MQSEALINFLLALTQCSVNHSNLIERLDQNVIACDATTSTALTFKTRAFQLIL